MIRDLENLKEVHCRGVNLTDRGLFSLRSLRVLEFIDISYCEKITSEGIYHLARLPNLRCLRALHCGRLRKSASVTNEFYRRAVSKLASIER